MKKLSFREKQSNNNKKKLKIWKVNRNHSKYVYNTYFARTHSHTLSHIQSYEPCLCTLFMICNYTTPLKIWEKQSHEHTLCQKEKPSKHADVKTSSHKANDNIIYVESVSDARSFRENKFKIWFSSFFLST